MCVLEGSSTSNLKVIRLHSMFVERNENPQPGKQKPGESGGKKSRHTREPLGEGTHSSCNTHRAHYFTE